MKVLFPRVPAGVRVMVIFIFVPFCAARSSSAPRVVVFEAGRPMLLALRVINLLIRLLIVFLNLQTIFFLSDSFKTFSLLSFSFSLHLNSFYLDIFFLLFLGGGVVSLSPPFLFLFSLFFLSPSSPLLSSFTFLKVDVFPGGSGGSDIFFGKYILF